MRYRKVEQLPALQWCIHLQYGAVHRCKNVPEKKHLKTLNEKNIRPNLFNY